MLRVASVASAVRQIAAIWASATPIGRPSVSRPQTISANVAPGDDKLRAYGEFSIKQSDFKIRLVSVAGGALKVKDELKLAFDIIAKLDS